MADGGGVVIIGGGQAGLQAAASLRQGGYGEPITIVTEEPDAPYQRPPLSKGFLLGDYDAERIPLKPEAFYAENDITLIREALVSEIDPHGAKVRLDRRGQRAEWLGFSKLILATGARAVTPPISSAEEAMNGWFRLRTRKDADALKTWAERPRHAVIVGGGYIGLEVAAAMRKLGHEATVLEAAGRILSRVSGPEIAEFYAAEHAAKGVKIKLNTPAFGLYGDIRVEGVRAGGPNDRATRLGANMIVFGMGVRPNQELAERAGLPCEDGIMTDEAGRTPHPDIYAIGDCARAWSPIYERPLRLESVQNAIDGAKAAAAVILGGEPPAPGAPWNWSDQYDLKLQTAGVWTDADQRVVRGDRSDRAFAVFYLRGGRLIACDAVNAAPEFVAARQLITRRARVAPELLRDTSTPMKDIIQAAADPDGADAAPPLS